ncbi:MAG: helix-turn-helix transcriptional regulator [Alphaproteobacteria bacterium]
MSPRRHTDDTDAYLARIGDRVRAARARRGMTRRALAGESGVSERYLAQLESGSGNGSIVLLRQVADAMHLPLHDLVRDGDDPPVELTLLTERLAGLDAAELEAVHGWLRDRRPEAAGRAGRIALIGLRGAGKSTLGQALADRLDVPFIQLDQAVAEAAGMSLAEVFDMFGQAGYRRLERRCLDDIVARHPRAVIEVGGGLAADPAGLERLLAACRVVWLKARPEEHMARVVEQGDQRPMAGNRQAMDDLRRILEGREPLYGKADFVLDTSGRAVEQCLDDLAGIAAA